MTLNEAAWTWGMEVWRHGDIADIPRSIASIEASTVLIQSLALTAQGDEWPHFTSDYVSLACVMYAQDVAEGRHT